MGAPEIPLCKHLACLNYLIFVHSALCRHSSKYRLPIVVFLFCFWFFPFFSLLFLSLYLVKFRKTNPSVKSWVKAQLQEKCAMCLPTSPANESTVIIHPVVTRICIIRLGHYDLILSHGISQSFTCKSLQLNGPHQPRLHKMQHPLSHPSVLKQAPLIVFEEVLSSLCCRRAQISLTWSWSDTKQAAVIGKPLCSTISYWQKPTKYFYPASPLMSSLY